MKADKLFDTRAAVTVSWLIIRETWIDKFTHGLLINIHIFKVETSTMHNRRTCDSFSRPFS